MVSYLLTNNVEARDPVGSKNTNIMSAPVRAMWVQGRMYGVVSASR